MNKIISFLLVTIFSASSFALCPDVQVSGDYVCEEANKKIQIVYRAGSYAGHGGSLSVVDFIKQDWQNWHGYLASCSESESEKVLELYDIRVDERNKEYKDGTHNKIKQVVDGIEIWGLLGGVSLFAPEVPVKCKQVRPIISVSEGYK